MNWVILVLLAIVISTAIVASSIFPMLYSREARAFFEDSYAIKKSLEEGEVLLSFRVYVQELNVPLSIVNQEGSLNLEASTVKIVFEVPSAPHVDNRSELFNVWGNKTHAGVSTWIKVLDNGFKITIVYVDAVDIGETFRIKVLEDVDVLKFYMENGRIFFNNTLIYSFSGYREIEVKKLELKF